MNDNNDVNVVLTKIKGALDRGELRKLQEIKKIRDKNRKESVEIKAKSIVEVRAQLESVGITKDDSMDTKFQNLKEASDKGWV